MSTGLILDTLQTQSDDLCEKLMCSVVSPPDSLSALVSPKEQTSVESEDLDSRTLHDSDSQDSSCSLPTPGTSPSTSSLIDTHSRLKSQQNSHEGIYYKHASQVDETSRFLEFSQDEFLLFMEPSPVFPPEYATLPPGGIPRYPILDSHHVNESLPAYTPAAYKLGVVCRKLEWLSPYEPSPSRSWKTLIMELNSTQLNFYHIPSSLESCFLSFVTSYLREDTSRHPSLDSIHESYRSLVTTPQDIQLLHLCEGLEFFKHDNHPEDNDDVHSSANSVHSKSLKSSKHKRLIRSFSLQHARIGLASDYTKKTNVLRLRLENEQFLLNFATAQDLIEWNLGLSVGRDVAMDLLEREIPRYRTVPRRRRAQFTSPISFYHEAVARRNRAHSDSQFESSSGLRSKFCRLKTRLSSLNLKGFTNQAQTSVQQQQLLQVKQFRAAVTSSLNDSYAPVGSMSSISVQRELNRQQGAESHGASFSFAAGEEEDEGSEYHPVLPHLSNAEDTFEEDGDDDIQNLSDLHRSDDEDEYDVELEDVSDFRATAVRPRRDTGSRSITHSNGDHKWRPPKKQESERRFTRNCLKCIKPLTFDESWVNKLLMKPAMMSPLSLAYLRTRFSISGPNSKDSSYTSLVSLPVLSHFDANMTSSPGPHRKRAFSQKDMVLSLADTSLARITNHHLKEYVVGSHSLIPNDV